MTTVHETIPDGLRPDVEAALAWYNSGQDVAFEVTGIVDPQEALEATGARDLHLVLCGGDRCEQRSFRVTPDGAGHRIALLGGEAPVTEGAAAPAELDPPPGARRGWLDGIRARHAFVVLVFYRGYW